MRLLVDSDMFCKLGLGNLLDDALVVLGVQMNDCARLPALPHMLRRGSLPRTYGSDACANLIPLADSLKAISAPNATWLDRVASAQAIDPGEAQIFATAAQDSLIVLTGDKRALRALKNISGYADALAGRIVVLEAILMALGDRLGYIEVRRKLGTVVTNDNTLKVCFSAGNPEPRRALESYYRSLVAEVHPLVLWEPQQGGAA
jgi:hypothetical protein